MASKTAITMTATQRETFKASGIKDPAMFLKKITGDQKAQKKRKFSFTGVKLDFWNMFDFVVVFVCYLPLGASTVTIIRLFRLLRVLKLIRALPELQAKPCFTNLLIAKPCLCPDTPVLPSKLQLQNYFSAENHSTGLHIDPPSSDGPASPSSGHSSDLFV